MFDVPAYRLVLFFIGVLLTATALTALAKIGPNAPDWPALGRTDNHVAYLPDPDLTPAKAQTEGIKWMANLYAADLGSPVVAYDAVLGKLVVYAGNERGDVFAIDAVDGTTIWSTNVGVGNAERATPLFIDGDVFIGTAYSPATYKLDGATGKVLCEVKGPGSFLASPMGATPPGGQPLVYLGAAAQSGVSGPAYAIREADCSQAFKFTGYVQRSGVVASASFGVDKNGQPLDVFGTTSPDSKIYALNAVTGAQSWVFKTANPPPSNYDVAAAATISPPGANGFADGVVYVPTRYGIMYALDLTTGKEIWSFNFAGDSGVTGGGLASAALAGNDLVFGYNGGTYDLNATTGAKVSRYADPSGSEVAGSPALVGVQASASIAYTNLAGYFRLVRRSNSMPLYSYKTGGYSVASPVYANHTFLVTSSDGFLYAFTPGGSNAAPPGTAFTYPAQNATVAYGSGTVTLTGTATGAAGIAGVNVAVQTGGSSGPWYDGATKTWNSAPYANPAKIVAGGSGATWTLTVPLASSGGVLTAIANAVATGNVADRVGATVTFSSLPGSTQPVVTLSASIEPPAGSVTASATGFAPSENVKFALAGTKLGTAQADANGTVAPTPLTIPAATAFGPTPLTATGATSGKTSSATLDVENAWVSLGYDATRASFEPNDTVLGRVPHVGPGLFVDPAYFAASPAGSPVESSPAIFDGVAFFGDDAGTLSALDTQTGAPIWQFTTPSGMPIVSAPTIDAGYAIFGSSDGSLYAVSAATGAELGSLALGGALTSPAAASGGVYVASKNGTITAISEATTAIVWQANVGTTIAGSVTADAKAGLLFVGDDLGYVSAYALATGNLAWHAKVGGALQGAPAVSGGVVYVGSSNGNLVALAESSGQLAWTYAEGTAIAATPAVAAGEPGFTGNAIYVGAADGTVTALTQAGKKAWSVPFPSAVVGLAATGGNVVIVELANGIVGATRGPSGGNDFYQFSTGASLDTAPAIVDGAVYVGSGAGGLYAFTPYGKEPMIRSKPGLSPRQRLLAVAPKTRWASFTTTGLHAIDKSMIWSGKRDYSLHVLGALARGSAAGVRFHGGVTQHAPRVYAVYWRPAGSTMSAAYHDATARWFAASKIAQLAGSYVDTSPFPARPSDAAFQSEIARVAALNHWPAGTNAQFVMLPAREAFGAWAGFCAYHSALGGARSGSPLVYAVVPYPSGASVCGAAAGITPTGTVDADLVLPTILREQTDVVRDPLGTGWFDAAGHEAGDFRTR
jgi:outer membrane protein assembly factor BamB